MTQKKKGFTLIEVLVVILISTVILSLVAGSMIFITNSSGDLIQEAEDIDMAKNIEKFLRGLVDNKTLTLEYIDKLCKGITHNKDNDTLMLNDGVVYSNTGLTRFVLDQGEDFVKCKMSFESGKEFEFILCPTPEN